MFTNSKDTCLLMKEECNRLSLIGITFVSPKGTEGIKGTALTALLVSLLFHGCPLACLRVMLPT